MDTQQEGKTYVANVEAGVIRQLLAEIATLEKDLRHPTGKLNREDRSDMHHLFSNNGTGFDVAQWSQLGSDEQSRLLGRLTLIRDDLLNGSVRPAGGLPDFRMEEEGLSRKTVIWLAIFAFIFVATLLSLLR